MCGQAVTVSPCSWVLNVVTIKHTVHEPRHGKTNILYAKTKAQIIFAVIAKMISAFVFATRIVPFLYFLNPKFPAIILCLYSWVCVRPVPGNRIVVFFVFFSCPHQ